NFAGSRAFIKKPQRAQRKVRSWGFPPRATFQDRGRRGRGFRGLFDFQSNLFLPLITYMVE
ncbi:MAG: hypothetical protein AAGM40_08995, partial [Cyanobacteria bacterium J06573_2]